MSRGHQNPEPMDDYCEIVQLGRRGVRRCDVTVFYKSVGRGEFDVDGGTIFLEQKRSGNRLLTIVSKNGDTIELTRERRGEYHIHTDGFWITEPEIVWVDN